MLFPDLKPQALPPEINFLNKKIQEVEASMFKEAKLVMMDAPWRYEGGLYEGAANGLIDQHYDTMSTPEIAAEVRRIGEAVEDARLAFWCTWPILLLEKEKLGWKNQDVKPWRYVSGGSWLKEHTGGMGHHWLGVSEPLLLYVKGKPGIKYGSLKNGYASPVGKHSEKPWKWLQGMIERWTDPGDLVIDVFAGLAPAARACFAANRRYVGIESSEERIAEATGIFHQWRYEENV